MPWLRRTEGLVDVASNGLLRRLPASDLADGWHRFSRDSRALEELVPGYVAGVHPAHGPECEGPPARTRARKLPHGVAHAPEAAAGHGADRTRQTHGLRGGRRDLLGGEEKGVAGRKLVQKALVAVAVELDGRKLGRARLRHVPDGSRKSLGGFIAQSVEPGSRIHTDGWAGYGGLATAGFDHRVTHSAGDESLAVEAFAHVHLVASLLKRWLSATHQGRVGHKHLQGYLDEFALRFNRRRSQHIGKIFHRLVEQLVLRQSSTYRNIVQSQEPSA